MFACQTRWFQLEAWKRQEIAIAMRQRHAGEVDDSEAQAAGSFGEKGTA
jgi:hypothetical protein